VDQSITVEVTIMQFSLYGGSPITLVLQGKFHPEILTVSLEWGVRQGSGVNNKPFFLVYNRQYLEKGKRYVQNYY